MSREFPSVTSFDFTRGNNCIRDTQFLLARCSRRGAKSFAFDRRTLASRLLLIKADEVAQSGHAARISARVQTRVARFLAGWTGLKPPVPTGLGRQDLSARGLRPARSLASPGTSL